MVESEDFEERFERRGEGRPNSRIVRAEGESAGHDIGGHQMEEGQHGGRRGGIVDRGGMSLEVGDGFVKGWVQVGNM